MLAPTVITFREEGCVDVSVQRITSAAMRLFWELPFEVIQTLQRFCHILQFKETAGQPEVGFQVARVQGDGFQAVS